jgi:hypothetical protein
MVVRRKEGKDNGARGGKEQVVYTLVFIKKLVIF